MLRYSVYTALFRPFPPCAASLDQDREQALRSGQYSAVQRDGFPENELDAARRRSGKSRPITGNHVLCRGQASCY